MYYLVRIFMTLLNSFFKVETNRESSIEIASVVLAGHTLVLDLVGAFVIGTSVLVALL